MNPIPTRLIEDPARIKRRLLCRHYSSCLDVAVANDWGGFTCRECFDYCLPAWGPLEWWEDAFSCAKLIGAIRGASWLSLPVYPKEPPQLKSVEINDLRPGGLLLPREVSQLLQVSFKQVEELCATGHLDHIRIGKLIRIKSESVIKFIDERPF